MFSSSKQSNNSSFVTLDDHLSRRDKADFDPTPYIRSWLAKGHRHAADYQSRKCELTDKAGRYSYKNVCCFQINSLIRVYTVIS